MSVLLSLCSCIYDYYPDVATDKPLIVIEGDILLGEECEFTAGSATSLERVDDGHGVFHYEIQDNSIKAEFQIEDDSGQIWNPVNTGKNIFDLSLAPSDRKYRLLVQVSSMDGTESRTFATPFASPEPAPVIGKVKIGADALTTGRVSVVMDLSAPGSSGCFRWDYEEIYRFHTALAAPIYEYDPDNNVFRNHSGDMEPNWWKYTWCWARQSSKKASIAIAKSLKNEALVNHEILSYDYNDPRFNKGEDGQSQFYLRLIARSIPEEAYRYLDAVNRGSDETASMLSPMPGEVIGNIRNVADTTDYAIGYVSVTATSSTIVKLEHKTTLRYERLANYAFNPLDGMLSMNPTEDWYMSRYRSVYYGVPARPYDSVNNWVPLRCIDCTADGGVLDPPDDIIMPYPDFPL